MATINSFIVSWRATVFAYQQIFFVFMPTILTWPQEQIASIIHIITQLGIYLFCGTSKFAELKSLIGRAFHFLEWFSQSVP